MLRADEAIEAIALKLILRGQLDLETLTPLMADLKRACADLNAADEIGQLDALLQVQPASPENYTAFSNLLDQLRQKLMAGAQPVGSAPNPVAPTPGQPPVLSYDTSNGPEIMNHFFLESTAHLEAVEKAALHLEANPQDQEALSGAFRAFHSLKGVTGFLGLTAARDLIHQAEALIEMARKRQNGMLAVECDRILRTVDMERSLVELVRAHSTEPDAPFPPLPPKYAALAQELKRSVAMAASGLRPAVVVTEPLAKTVPPAAPIPPAGPATPTAPAAPTPPKAPVAPAGSRVDRRRGPAASAAALAAIVQPEAPAPTPALPAEPVAFVAPPAPMVSPAVLAAIPAPEQRASNQVDERPASNAVAPHDSGLIAAADGEGKGTLQFNRRETDASIAALVRVQVEKLDRLIDAIGELAITQIQIFQNEKLAAIEDEALNRNVALAGKVTRELQTLAMTLRMVPLRETFGRMTRLARDIAHQQGKEVSVVIEGEETEMDKSLIEMLLDPLTHLVRNAVDHGVGLPAEREMVGKPRRATLRLAARSQGGFVMVEVTDDGHGLNLAKIQAKARQRGLLREGETADPFRLQQFIFETGFSTADKVTDLSGRGIGLDVVRNQAASAGGRVAVQSVAGQSTKFTITLPLTLAIIDGLIVRSGRQEFILPLTLVVESLRPKPEQMGTVHERGLTVALRGHAFPLVRLAEYARVKDARKDPCDSIVIIVDSRGEQYALQVDEILGVQQVVIKNLGDRLHGLKGISGGAILGDGRVRLILDVVGILAQSRAIPWQAAG